MSCLEDVGGGPHVENKLDWFAWLEWLLVFLIGSVIGKSRIIVRWTMESPVRRPQATLYCKRSRGPVRGNVFKIS
jgi:hypothetical protein